MHYVICADAGMYIAAECMLYSRAFSLNDAILEPTPGGVDAPYDVLPAKAQLDDVLGEQDDAAAAAAIAGLVMLQ